MQRRSSTQAQLAGDTAEEEVAARLAAQGWAILARNVRVGRSEVDILAVDPGPPAVLAMVEVRWRSRRDYGLAEETIDWRKRTSLRRAVGGLLEQGSLPDGTPLPRLPLRVDLVAVDVDGDGALAVRHHRAIVL